MLDLGEQATKKNLKVGVGLMCRHCDARGELYKRIRDGEMGELTLLQAYRMHGPVGSAFTKAYDKRSTMSELLYQIRNFHSFLWASGGCYSDFYVHNIDECCWMKDAWPVKAQATGGRHYRGDYVDQNFDNYSVEYTFADGTKLYLAGRTMDGCYPKFASHAFGTKGCAVISQSNHFPAKSRIYSGFNMDDKSKITWKFEKDEPSPYRLEWDHLLKAIRDDKTHNEVKRGAQASLVTAMGRMAAHTGQVVEYKDMLENGQELAAELDKLTMESPAPLQADKNGKYPIPQPGKVTKTEF
jgi:predicted dehydrogenase